MITNAKNNTAQHLEKDCVILGGGCSGLGLAYELSKHQHQMHCLVLESRPEYTHDKTWCFWEKTTSEWTRLATCSWSQWSFQVKSMPSVTHTSNTWRYYHLPSILYYQKIQNALNHHDQIQLQLKQKVIDIQAQPQQKNNKNQYPWRITTESGLIIKAKRIIDTRPNQLFKSTLYQCFFGLEVHIHNQSTRTVQLMHDMCCDTRGFRFNYLLPLSPTSLLFEHTRFCTDPIDQPTLEQECMQAIKYKFPQLNLKQPSLTHTLKQHQRPAEGTITRKEWGCLPMGLKHEKPEEQFDIGGMRSGALRNATGYGFKRIQQWAAHTAQQLIQQHDKPQQPLKYQYDTQWQKNMDALFLRTLKKNPTQAPLFFSHLANKTSPDTLVRFLNDQANWKDLSQIIWALPSWPFIRQSFSLSRMSI